MHYLVIYTDKPWLTVPLPTLQQAQGLVNTLQKIGVAADYVEQDEEFPPH